MSTSMSATWSLSMRAQSKCEFGTQESRKSLNSVYFSGAAAAVMSSLFRDDEFVVRSHQRAAGTLLLRPLLSAQASHQPPVQNLDCFRGALKLALADSARHFVVGPRS